MSPDDFNPCSLEGDLDPGDFDERFEASPNIHLFDGRRTPSHERPAGVDVKAFKIWHRQAVEFMADGMGNREIAAELASRGHHVKEVAISRLRTNPLVQQRIRYLIGRKEKLAATRRATVNDATSAALEVLKQACEGHLAYPKLTEDGFPDPDALPSYLPVPVRDRIGAAKTIADRCPDTAPVARFQPPATDGVVTKDIMSEVVQRAQAIKQEEQATQLSAPTQVPQVEDQTNG